MNKEKENIQNLEEKIKLLPKNSGVYLMKDKHLNIIYVGKAVNLKNRVTQYFRKNAKVPRIEKMVQNIFDFEYIITNTEDEALILENNLIKKYRPKFNVLLKDGKTYPYIMLNTNDVFPTLSLVRRIKNDRNKYFGPYPSSNLVKVLIDEIKEKCKLRFCDDRTFIKVTKENYKEILRKNQPCLYSHIKKCDGICQGKVSLEEYETRVKQAINILSGNIKNLLKSLENEMEYFSNKFEFEKAAEIRDKIEMLKRQSEDQKVSNLRHNSIDVIGISRKGVHICVVVFEIRGSKLENTHKIFLEDYFETDFKNIVETLIPQYYLESFDIPSKIMVKYDFEDREKIQKILTQKYESNIEIVIPKKGANIKLIEMAEENAKNQLKIKKDNILEDIKKELKLSFLPRRIESYDISNLSRQQYCRRYGCFRKPEN